MPDHLLQKTVVVKIDMSTEGILAKELTKLYKIRLAYKQTFQETHDEIDNSKQNIYKLQLNSTYGYEGAKHARWGNMLIALTTCAIGRWLLYETINFIREAVIEVDTDGLYLDREINIAQLQDRINTLVLSTTVPTNYLSVDIDTYDGSYFYKQKNYILRKNNKFIYSGSSFASRRSCKIAKLAQEQIIQCLFSAGNTTELIKQLYDFKNKPIEDFAMDIRLREDISTYKTHSSIGYRIAAQIYEAFGGTELLQASYVVTSCAEKYKPLTIATKEELLLSYYATELDHVLERFNLSRTATLTNSIPTIQKVEILKHSKRNKQRYSTENISQRGLHDF